MSDKTPFSTTPVKCNGFTAYLTKTSYLVTLETPTGHHMATLPHVTNVTEALVIVNAWRDDGKLATLFETAGFVGKAATCVEDMFA